MSCDHFAFLPFSEHAETYTEGKDFSLTEDRISCLPKALWEKNKQTSKQKQKQKQKTNKKQKQKTLSPLTLKPPLTYR